MRYTRKHAETERNARLRARRALRREEIARAEREQRDALKRRMLMYLGGACSRCPLTLEQMGHVAPFDFHHVDWREKRFSFSGNYKRKWETLREELAKCVVVCANCHRIIEATLAEPGRRRGRPPLTFAAACARSPDEQSAQIVARAAAEERRAAAEREVGTRHQLDMFDARGRFA